MKRKFINRPSTVDIICFSGNNQDPTGILLIKRGHEPFEGMLAFPGGFIDKESAEQAAVRELLEETGIHAFAKDLKLLGVYSMYDRDPRHTISIVYTLHLSEKISPIAGDDANAAEWVYINDIHELAFDHMDMLKDFKEKFWYSIHLKK